MQISICQNENELIERCQHLTGLTILQLSKKLGVQIPNNPNQRKGFIGQAIELFLGTTAGTSNRPDFDALGIELKTIPLNNQGIPAESTFVTSAPLLKIGQQDWQSSNCYAKLKRVLWIPVEGDKNIAFSERRIGMGFLWSPNEQQMAILKHDWETLTDMIAMGGLEQIHAGMGEYLQIRPKAANASSVCYGLDFEGKKILTLPRGFYLRATFTATLL